LQYTITFSSNFVVVVVDGDDDIFSCWLGLLLLPWMNAVFVLPLLLILGRSLSSMLLFSFVCQLHCVMIQPRVIVSAASDGSGIPTSSYSSFYIRPASAASSGANTTHTIIIVDIITPSCDATTTHASIIILIIIFHFVVVN